MDATGSMDAAPAHTPEGFQAADRVRPATEYRTEVRTRRPVGRPLQDAASLKGPVGHHPAAVLQLSHNLHRFALLAHATQCLQRRQQPFSTAPALRLDYAQRPYAGPCPSDFRAAISLKRGIYSYIMQRAGSAAVLQANNRILPQGRRGAAGSVGGGRARLVPLCPCVRAGHACKLRKGHRQPAAPASSRRAI